MDRQDVLKRFLYPKCKSAIEFQFDSLIAKPLLYYLTPQDIMQLNKIATSLKLSPNQIFLINKYKNQARFFKEQELQNITRELRNLDYKYKIGLIDLNVGLEAILCAYI
jgi:hypothetical protein